MMSFDDVRRTAQARVIRFHAEASHARNRPHTARSIRATAASIARSFATWIDPEAPPSRGAHHASP